MELPWKFRCVLSLRKEKAFFDSEPFQYLDLTYQILQGRTATCIKVQIVQWTQYITRKKSQLHRSTNCARQIFITNTRQTQNSDTYFSNSLRICLTRGTSSLSVFVRSVTSKLPLEVSSICSTLLLSAIRITFVTVPHGPEQCDLHKKNLKVKNMTYLKLNQYYANQKYAIHILKVKNMTIHKTEPILSKSKICHTYLESKKYDIHETEPILCKSKICHT